MQQLLTSQSGYIMSSRCVASSAFRFFRSPNSTWWGETSLPSRACEHSSDLTGKAYQACGEPPLLSPGDISTQFEKAPPVQPWNQVSVAQHTQTPLRAASQREPPEPHPCVPPRCPTAGSPMVPLVPLVRSLRAWLALPSPPHWFIRTIRLGYAIVCPVSPRSSEVSTSLQWKLLMPMSCVRRL